MAWWGGEGAARLLAHEGHALLLERAMGERSLAQMARGGGDDEGEPELARRRGSAARATAGAAGALVPLRRWFEALAPAAARQGVILAQAAEVTRELLDEPRDVVVLHGDLHHGNVLDFEERGWLAVDPTRLIGERGFELATILGDRRGGGSGGCAAPEVGAGACRPVGGVAARGRRGATVGLGHRRARGLGAFTSLTELVQREFHPIFGRVHALREAPYPADPARFRLLTQ